MRLGSGPVLEIKPIDHVIMVAMGVTAGAYLAVQFGERKAGPPVWTLNNGCFGIRADLCFDMHTAAVLAGDDNYRINEKCPMDPNLDKFLPGMLTDLTREYKKTGVDVVTLDGHDDTFEYPLKEVIDDVQDDYFTIGPAYMIAYAMACQAKEMSFFGFDWSYGDGASEMALEPGRACVEYWLGRAFERGTIMNFACDTTLKSRREIARKGLYGYGRTQPMFKAIDGKMRLIGYDRGRTSITSASGATPSERPDPDGGLRRIETALPG